MVRYIILILMLSVYNCFAADIYVDNTLLANCTAGNYSIANRDCNGSDGNAYTSVQAAITAVAAGDTIYMRGGTYNENTINIPVSRTGTADAPITVRSYPGEWAIVDAQHAASYAVIRRKGGNIKYWNFKNFEITGGGSAVGTSSGGGIMLDTGTYCTFEYLYIHDNYGGGSTNDGGICIKNDVGYAPQYNVIKYCYLKDNGDPDNYNTGNIILFADYKDPGGINFETTRRNNEICYNLIIGGAKGIKSKNDEGLTNDNTAQNMTMKENGDKIHHNIVLDFHMKGIENRQDFIQVYNNIVASDYCQTGIIAGCNEYNTDREPFYATVYNNLLIGVDLSVEHQYDSLYGPPYHPYIYFYNNILEDVGAQHVDVRNDINILPWYSSRGEDSITMSTVFVDYNLLYGRSLTDAVIETGGDGNEYSATSYVTAGYADKMYATTTVGLHPDGEDYKTVSSFSISSGKTIADGGIGGNHPYLSGVTLPFYMGAVNPNGVDSGRGWDPDNPDPDDAGWVDFVLNLPYYLGKDAVATIGGTKQITVGSGTKSMIMRKHYD